MSDNNEEPTAPSMNDVSYGPDFFKAIYDLGFVAKNIILQKAIIEHGTEEFSTVTLTCHIRPSDFKRIADCVAAGVELKDGQ